MNKKRHLLLLIAALGLSATTHAQSLDESGISAGFLTPVMKAH